MRPIKHRPNVSGHSAAAIAAGLALALANAGIAEAHHALDALYDISNEIEATATLTRIDWINPHAWMRFDIPKADGQFDRNVMLETLSISNLRQKGVDRADLKIGAQYKITYYPNRDGKPGGYITDMVLPGGATISAPNCNVDTDECQSGP